jgi:transcription elongation factor Elf1
VSDDTDDVPGFLKTHFDCPVCGYDDSVEGDASGDTVVCDDCGTTFTIGVVR